MGSSRLSLARAAPALALLAPLWLHAAAQQATAQQATAQQAHPLFDAAPQTTRLPNGLTVVSVPWSTPGIVAYYTLVRVGSRDEVEPGHSGFAHLFEHMMFRGTEAMPGPVYEERVQAVGADNNAYTTRDFTLYTLTAPATALESLVEIEAERFQRLSYDEDVFRTETGAVQGEYAKSASGPFLPMWEALSELAFQRHTYGHTTMGYLRDICAMPTRFAYSRRFFQRFYTPDNTTLIVVGDVDHARLVSLVRERYGRWRGRRDQPRVQAEPEPTEGRSRHLPWDASTPPRAFLAYRTPSFDGGAARGAARAAAIREAAALELVKGLAFAEPSPLFQRLVVDERRLLELSAWERSFTRDPGLLVVTTVLAPGEGAPDFEGITEAIQAELGRIAAGEIEPEQIEAVRSNLRYSLLTDVETPSDVADLLGNFAAAGGSIAALDEYLAALAAVTPGEVAAVARRYLTPTRRFRVTLAERSEADGPTPTPAPLCPEPTGGAR
ncbi:MAG: insulinase family protein [Myxococcales bacterium]|nr:insulinase family protein [Myxococcales bacterium]